MPQSQQLAATLWSLAVGTVTFLVIYYTVRSGWFDRAGDAVMPAEETLPEVADPIDSYPVEEADGIVPFVLKGIIVGYAIFLVFYVVYFVRALNGPLGTIDKFLTK